MPRWRGGVAASTISLTFTTTNHNTVQTVTVTGVDDNMDNPGGGREVTHQPSNTDLTGAGDVSETDNLGDFNINAQAQTTINICDRTPQIKAKILRALGKTEADCGTIISTELAGITTLAVREDQSLTTLQDGDFDNLISLAHLDLSDNSISSVPAGLFDDLTSLRRVYLLGNNLSGLPAGLFDDLTSLRWLSLSQNSLSSVPAGVFDNLTSLQALYLYNNNLSSLPAGLFDNLTRLTYLSLNNNDLSSLPADVFDNLTRLAHLSLTNNDLSSLPAGVFDNLTRLTYLSLTNNNLACLPSIPSSVTNLRQGLSRLPACGARVIITESGNATLVSEASGADRTDTYTVALSNRPTGSVSIAVASSTPTAATVSPATLTFTTANWNMMQTVTVTGVDDSAHQSSNRSATISHTATSSDPEYSGITIPDVTATVVDNDGAGVTLIESGGATAVTEAAGRRNTDSYMVTLNAAPTADVEITIASGDTGAATVSPTTLTFTLSNWNTGQTVTVTGVDDSLDQSSGRSVIISHRATSRDTGYSDIPIRDVTATVVNNDRPPGVVTITESDGVTSVTEAAGATNTDTYTVVLDLEPTASVTIEAFVEVVSFFQNLGDEFLVTVSPTILTFTTSNWNTAQTVTVTGVDNNVDQGKDSRVSILIYNSSIDPNYDDPNPIIVIATVMSDDTAGVTINEFGGATSVTEAPGAGSTDTYTVVLDSEPAAAVTIAIESGDSGAATVSPATLTFTTSNWGTTQAVTVTGVDDDVDQSSDRSVTISHGATSSGPDYNGISISDVTAVVMDDDVRGVTVSASSSGLSIREADDGSTGDAAEHVGNYTVVLDSEPTGNVTITVESSTPSAATVSPATLTFTSGNWSTPQAVTVTGVDDDLDNPGNQRQVTISHGVSASGTDYEDETAASVVVTVGDDDGTGVTIKEPDGSTSVTEKSGDDDVRGVTVSASSSGLSIREADDGSTGDAAEHVGNYTVVLDSEPTGNVTITVESGTPSAATVSPATLTFTTSNWGTAQTVTVTGVDDDLDNPGDQRQAMISHDVSGAGTDYEDETAASVVVTVTDDDGAGVTIKESDGSTSVTEKSGDGRSDTYTVVLDSEPTAEVTITVESGDSGAATVSPATLTFTTTNWNTAQTVTVTGVDDQVDQSSDRSVTISHSATSSDTTYDQINITNVTATVMDDDVRGVTVSASSSSLRISEADDGGTDEVTEHVGNYTVVLDSEPTGNVAITVESGTPSAATVSPATLTFTSSDWSSAQTVTVTGVDDGLDNPGDQRQSIISHDVSGAGTDYEEETAASVVVTVTDDDGAGVTIKESDGSTSVTEKSGGGRSDTYTVVLDSEPTTEVTITVESGDSGAATVSPATLTFTTTNWNTAQTVTVTGVDDQVDQSSDRSVTISHRATSSDTTYDQINIANVTATVMDNDMVGVTITESDGFTSVTEASGEGHTDTYIIVLDSQPTANVGIEAASGTTTAATVSPATLTFTTTNWNTAQTVTVTGVDDKVDQSGNRTATISHSATSSDAQYNNISISSVTATVTATVVDDDLGLKLKEWHLRFGRAVSQQVVDALQDRFCTHPAGGLQLTVAGEPITSVTPLEYNQGMFPKPWALRSSPLQG